MLTVDQIKEAIDVCLDKTSCSEDFADMFLTYIYDYKTREWVISGNEKFDEWKI